MNPPLPPPVLPTGSWWHWRQRQRPRLGVHLLKVPGGIRAMELPRDLGAAGIEALSMDLHGNEELNLVKWARRCGDAGILFILRIRLDQPDALPPAHMILFDLLRRMHFVHSGILVQALLPQDPFDREYEKPLGRELLPFLEEHSLPLIVTTDEPLSPSGDLMRRLECQGVGILATDTAGFEPDLIHLRTLAGRLPRMPMSVSLRRESFAGEDLPRYDRRGIASALAAGASLILLDALPEDLPQVKETVQDFVPTLEESPEIWPEPRPPQACVMVRETSEGFQSGAPVSALLGATKILRQKLCVPTRLCFESNSPPKAPPFLWVPAHGPLGPRLWNILMGLAKRGSEVLVTGLSLEDELERKRVSLLGFPLETLDTSSDRFPPWLRGAKLLNTKGGLFSTPVHLGRLHFSDQCFELDPEDGTGPKIIAPLLKASGWEAQNALPEGGCFARLSCGRFVLSANLDKGTTRILPG